MIECIIIVYGLLSPGSPTDANYRLALPLTGTLIKESKNQELLYVDFGPSLRAIKASGALNNSVKWVPQNDCLNLGP